MGYKLQWGTGILHHPESITSDMGEGFWLWAEKSTHRSDWELSQEHYKWEHIVLNHDHKVSQQKLKWREQDNNGWK
jgi:hypothetical protein